LTRLQSVSKKLSKQFILRPKTFLSDLINRYFKFIFFVLLFFFFSLMRQWSQTTGERVMTKFTFGRKCPHCNYNLKKRIPLRFWMRLIPRAKHYRCIQCGCKYISISERRSGLKDRRRTLPLIITVDRRYGIADRRRKIRV
jgi:hypothetical protein